MGRTMQENAALMAVPRGTDCAGTPSRHATFLDRIGSAIQLKMKQDGWTFEALAAETGINKAILNNLAPGTRRYNPPLTKWFRIVDWLGLPLSSFDVPRDLHTQLFDVHDTIRRLECSEERKAVLAGVIDAVWRETR